MTTTMQRVARARSALVLDHPWFGVLSLRLQVIEQPGSDTMSTDGTDLVYDPAFVDTLDDAQLTGLIAHEVMHCALRHMYRAGSRDLKRWNDACDHAINPLLTATGFALPPNGLSDPRFKDMSAEAIYAKLQAEEQQDDKSQAGDDDKPGPAGGFTVPQDDAGKPDAGDEPGDGDEGDDGNAQSGKPSPQHQMTETDWEVAVEQATAVAAKRGHIASELQRAVAANREPTTNWRDVLREFVQQVTPSDYSWQRPNRRYISGGLYMPGIVKEGCPRLVVAIDTSGSINRELLDTFASEMNTILHQCQPESIDVVYCDASVQAEQSFTPNDELTAMALTPKGGGGTAFQPVFDHVAERDDVPAALIYFTDLDGDKPSEPGYPVLWVTPEWVHKAAPFGTLVKLTNY